jgi:V8-like Glu-specific endopeptidase
MAFRSISLLLLAINFALAVPTQVLSRVTDIIPTLALHKTAATPINIYSAESIFSLPNRELVPSLASLLLLTTTSQFNTITTPASIPVPTVSIASIPKKGLSLKVSTPRLPRNGGVQVVPDSKTPLRPIVTRNNLGLKTSFKSPLLVPRDICDADRYCCPNDPRSLNQNNNYPWNAIGRFSNPKGSCTGTLVGPRHVLTASHCISCPSSHLFPFLLIK